MVKFFVILHATWEGERKIETEIEREKQDSQRANNVTLRRVGATIVAVEKQ